MRLQFIRICLLVCFDLSYFPSAQRFCKILALAFIFWNDAIDGCAQGWRLIPYLWRGCCACLVLLPGRWCYLYARELDLESSVLAAVQLSAWISPSRAGWKGCCIVSCTLGSATYDLWVSILLVTTSLDGKRVYWLIARRITSFPSRRDFEQKTVHISFLFIYFFRWDHN